MENEVTNGAEDEQPLSLLSKEKDDSAAVLNDLGKLPSDNHLEEETVNEWVSGDNDLENDFFSNDQIREKVIEEANESGVADESEDGNKEEKIINHEERKKMNLN